MATNSIVTTGMKLDDIYAICSKPKEDIGKWLRREGVLGDFTDHDCPKCSKGRMRLTRDTSYSRDVMVWKCSDRTCNKKVSIRKGTWFEGSHLALEQILKLTYYWVWHCEHTFIMRECSIGSNSTIVDWCYFAREVCLTVLEKESGPIGGPGKIVEVDESKFGKRKYNRGRRVEGQWVFGGIERGSKRCFVVTVGDRSAATLIPLIKHWKQGYY